MHSAMSTVVVSTYDLSWTRKQKKNTKKYDEEYILNVQLHVFFVLCFNFMWLDLSDDEICDSVRFGRFGHTWGQVTVKEIVEIIDQNEWNYNYFLYYNKKTSLWLTNSRLTLWFPGINCFFFWYINFYPEITHKNYNN